MKKTTVYLPEDLKSALGRVAAQKGRSEVELIREAIRELVRDSEPPRPRQPLFSSDDPTPARRFEEELAASASDARPGQQRLAGCHRR